MAILPGKGGLVPLPKVGYAAILPALTSPKEFIKGALEAPTFGVGGPAATVFKSITKTTGMKLGSVLLGAGGGLLAGALLSGGGKQEQKQAAAQELEQQQEQRQAAALRAMIGEFRAEARQEMAARAAGQAETRVGITPTITPSYLVTAGGDVAIGGVTTQTDTTTTTINVTGLTQEQYSAQVGQMLLNMQLALQSAQQAPIITQTQEATQEGGGINTLLIVGALLGGAYLIFGGKKRAR